MITQQLLDYIKQQLAQGISKEIINSNLLSQGWQQQDVDEAFSAAENQSVIVPQSPQISFTSEKNKTTIILIVVGGALLLIGLGVGGFFLFSKVKPSPQTIQPTQQPTTTQNTIPNTVEKQKEPPKPAPQEGTIELSLTTLRQAFEFWVRAPGSLNDPATYHDNRYFKEIADLADDVNIDLSTELDKTFSAGSANNKFFSVFHNFARASGCKRDYLIQRVKVTDTGISDKGEGVAPHYKYLVEAFKLDADGRFKDSPDQHKTLNYLNTYSLGVNFSKRHTTTDLEIGCGVVPNTFDENKMVGHTYVEIQDYSSSPGYYDKVVFEFSKKFSIEEEFDSKGNYYYSVPELGIKESRGY